MHTLIPLRRRTLPVWLSLAMGLAAFFSPAIYFLLLLLADRFHISANSPEVFVAALFYCLPPVALVVCGFLIWQSSMTATRKIVSMVFTIVAMLVEVGVLLAIIIMATG